MIPENLQEKLAAFVRERQSTVKELIVRSIARGLSPEDLIFILPADDAASQKVTAIMFGLEKEAAAGPLPKGLVVGKADFFATRGRTFEQCEPGVSRELRSRLPGSVNVLAVVDGYFCEVSFMYLTQGRKLPEA